MKLTDGAWAKYDIPADKLPPVTPARRRRVLFRPTPLVKSKSESLSQVSQIDTIDDRRTDNYADDEEINGSWSQSQSMTGRERDRGRLNIIDEEEEGRGEGGVNGGLPDFAPLDKGGWAEPGFFGESEAVGFSIWRDGY